MWPQQGPAEAGFDPARPWHHQKGPSVDPWDLGELGSLHPLLLPYSVRVGCCCCMKAFNSLSIHKVRDKEKESTEKKGRNHKAKLSAGASWHQLSNFHSKPRLRDTSVLSDSAHLGSSGPGAPKCGSNYTEIPNLASISASG